MASFICTAQMQVLARQTRAVPIYRGDHAGKYLAFVTCGNNNCTVYLSTPLDKNAHLRDRPWAPATFRVELHLRGWNTQSYHSGIYATLAYLQSVQTRFGPADLPEN